MLERASALETIGKLVDRRLNIPDKNRPDTAAYYELMSGEEYCFTKDFISFVDSISPNEVKITAILIGSLSRQFDGKLFNFPKRIPRDIDLVFTSGGIGWGMRTSLKDAEAIEKSFFLNVEKYLSKANISFMKGAYGTERESLGGWGSEESRLVDKTTQYKTRPTKGTRSFDLVFYKFLEHDATEEFLELMQSRRSPGVILVDKRDPQYITAWVEANRRTLKSLSLKSDFNY